MDAGPGAAVRPAPGAVAGFEELRERAVWALLSARAAYAEVRCEVAGACCVSAIGTRIESLTKTEDEGGYVRVRVGDNWGLSSFSGAAGMVPALRQAGLGARLAGSAGRADRRQSRSPRIVVRESDGEPPPWSERPAEAGEALRRIASSFPLRSTLGPPHLRLRARTSRVFFANCEGTAVELSRVAVQVSVSLALPGPRGGASVVWEFHGSADRPLSPGVICDAAPGLAREVLEMAAARTLRPGRYTVVLHPEVAGLLAHHAGHCFQADRRPAPSVPGNRLFPGRRVARAAVTLVDSGLVPGEAGSMAFDDEGTRAGVTHLVREGVAAGILHSRETAAAAGATPTGNGRTPDWRTPPAPRVTNTYFEPGTTPAADMMLEASRGVYIRRAVAVPDIAADGGAQVAIVAVVAYALRRGRPAAALSGVVLRGSPLDLLALIGGVGDDLGWSGRATCGRATCGGDQGGVPVGMGGPHVLLEGVPLG